MGKVLQAVRLNGARALGCIERRLHRIDETLLTLGMLGVFGFGLCQRFFRLLNLGRLLEQAVTQSLGHLLALSNGGPERLLGVVCYLKLNLELIDLVKSAGSERGHA